MNKKIRDGIPLVPDYEELLKSKSFKDLKKFSDRFLLENNDILRDYAKKWVSDPLHQWSRQWEYPFVFGKVQQIAEFNSKPAILDAGSGVTFFPYLVKSKFETSSVYCCDYDTMLLSLYDEINARQEKHVECSTSDLRDLPYEEEKFHMVYCVSVLEHTDDYDAIIEEFYRVLLPDGVLVVTFDISMDGTRDIDTEKAGTLLTALAELLAPILLKVCAEIPSRRLTDFFCTFKIEASVFSAVVALTITSSNSFDKGPMLASKLTDSPPVICTSEISMVS